ncbi:hypothetical protein [Streptomyces sp. KMM 9044]|uniref:hypothetical protein n=1 Tax=Streptomyces sp. KMM 9044 TaxID=2744474 RepID=UPI002151A826|nr:hypothetical protein [Streptomyces sp. KMM 9044]WAX78206.1 hypothetical protein HUV60_011500 [Streptomyces sp. KMM 9044]
MMLRASACHNYSPESSGNAPMVQKMHIPGVSMAEMQQFFPEETGDSGSSSPA